MTMTILHWTIQFTIHFHVDTTVAYFFVPIIVTTILLHSYHNSFTQFILHDLGFNVTDYIGHPSEIQKTIKQMTL